MLNELLLKHHDLDERVTEALSEGAYMDQLFLRRIKKEKLELKDRIERLRSSLIPDLDA